jgi:hypothetical protein
MTPGLCRERVRRNRTQGTAPVPSVLVVPDVRVVMQSLLDAAHGVNAVMDELAAHDVGDLGTVTADFCARWSHGLANLTDDGNALARGLDEAARAYACAEDLAVDQFRWGR